MSASIEIRWTTREVYRRTIGQEELDEIGSDSLLPEGTTAEQVAELILQDDPAIRRALQSAVEAWSDGSTYWNDSEEIDISWVNPA